MNASIGTPGSAEDDLPARALRALEERFGARDWRPLPQAIAARKVRIRLLESAQMGRRVALREYREPFACERQAEALRFGSALGSRGERFDVPDLYAVFEDRAALLLEWVPALHLERVLVRAAAAPREHWAAVRDSGTWLRRFHELDGITRTRFDAAHYAARLSARIAASLPAAALLERDPLWHSSRARFETLLARADGSLVAEARVHGDFTSTNILVGAGRVTGIDVWAEHRRPVAEDLARMFVYLAMGDLTPFLARLLPVAPERRRAQRALFAGYGSDLAPTGEPWHALVLFEALARRLAIEERLMRRASYPESWKCGGLRSIMRGIAGG